MKSLPTLIALSAALLAAPAAFANAELAQKKNCMSCHQVDKKVVGPAYKEVAAKYKGQKDAVTYLAERIVKGSVPGKIVFGGPMGMPPNAQVTEAEAKQLATWVLSIK
ncbi:c-type cytochrome [Paucibacter sp. JuS9]|uniref:c-type cytochrome n=1 Tax=Paucibacter sp. JuS9 TaxID=3228748 RepID=UPI0037570004